jgi:hypothetical protein
MKNSFTVSQDLSHKEYLSSNLYFVFHSRRLRLYGLYLTGIFLLSLFLGFPAKKEELNLIKLVGSLAPVVFLGVVLILGVILLSFYIYRSRPHLFKNVSYEFTHWGVTRHGEKTEFSKPRREITKIKETKAFFLFYAGIDMHTIPKRVFGTQEELDEFRQFLKNYYPRGR